MGSIKNWDAVNKEIHIAEFFSVTSMYSKYGQKCGQKLFRGVSANLKKARKQLKIKRFRTFIWSE